MVTKSIQAVCSEVLDCGYSIIEDFLDKKTIDQSQKALRWLNLGPRERIANIKDDLFYNISYSDYILEVAKLFFDEEAKPIQSLLFKYPTQQLIHQDTVHFSTYPNDMMLACWIALEDVCLENGTLEYIPYSHLLPTFSKYDFPTEHRDRGLKSKDLIKAAYCKYENNLQRTIKSLNLRPKYLSCKAGTAFIWHPRLWHGGSKPRNETLTRYSYVTHYEAAETPIYLKHFNGLPLLPRLENPKDLKSQKQLYRYGIFSFANRLAKILTLHI
ncbi:phytanoyl-CoA dioxygenase family protein [Synechococcus sp. BIOS-U3-1]|uniref:phytanoyl-CoA dioxygenase family protein n=1 Tax=Synechococcus sp. BIOS-U3-1 TaxID=1400865 RepID=UPI001646050D|nr:phytanoyl-CoA dioxygenase family protein [Synechococcus sp. BIOS-U3-1]QNI60163.1 phytanoyl-CoA dioxygenase family protein [Synechococcus sp. BIOS-U3-1]